MSCKKNRLAVTLECVKGRANVPRLNSAWCITYTRTHTHTRDILLKRLPIFLFFLKFYETIGDPEIKNTKYATSTQYRVFLYFFFVHKVRNNYARSTQNGVFRSTNNIFFCSSTASPTLRNGQRTTGTLHHTAILSFLPMSGSGECRKNIYSGL